VDASLTGVHAVELSSGRVLGSITWPLGNQIFAVQPLEGIATGGLPFAAGERGRARWRHDLFFTRSASAE
jgi:hypothetical protein